MEEGNISPIRLNALKHHAGFIKAKLEEWKQIPLKDYEDYLLELGENQFDIYTGNLNMTKIGEELNENLRINRITSGMELHQWLGKQGYKTVTLSDSSRWVIRESESDKDYAHVHPARNQPLVSRIKANHLKIAIAIILEQHELKSQNRELTTRELNRIRVEKFGLSPVKSVEDSAKILWTIQFLTKIVRHK